MLERGYKSWCESYSVDARAKLGIASYAPLDPRVLAKHLGIRVMTPHDVAGLGESTLRVLLRNDGKTPSCWSAVTVVVGSKVAVIVNSSHSPARQSSDLMHELAHRIREHETQEVDISDTGLMLLNNYDKVQEEEADWLSGALLLPRDALASIKRKKLADEDAAKLYGVSTRMLAYRNSMTGINRQFR